MHIPCRRERVEVAGREEVFLVLGVNLGTQSVELVPLTGAGYVLEASFSAIRPLAAESLVELSE
jgi:hypothetical protein